jgi:hypothetical protein
LPSEEAPKPKESASRKLELKSLKMEKSSPQKMTKHQLTASTPSAMFAMADCN